MRPFEPLFARSARPRCFSTTLGRSPNAMPAFVFGTAGQSVYGIEARVPGFHCTLRRAVRVSSRPDRPALLPDDIVSVHLARREAKPATARA